MTAPTWISALVLAALLAALALGLSWPWGALFIYWAALSFLNGQAFLIGPIGQSEAPVLFWLVTLLWIAIGVLMILSDVAPKMLARVQ